MVIRRRLALALGVVAAGSVAAYFALPVLAKNHVEAQLADHGFAGATVGAAKVGWNHLQLRDVHLQPGLDIARVDVDRGVTALWKPVNTVAAHDARISLEQLGELADRVAALRAHRNALIANVSIDGELRSERFELGPYALTAVRVPFDYNRDGLRIRGARAGLAGGELTLDTRGTALVLGVRGVQLEQLLAPTRRVAGTGLVDGEISIDVGSPGLSRTRGELHARGKGTLRTTALPGNDRVSATLADFAYDKLTARVGNDDNAADLVVAVSGRGRRNNQQVEMSINLRGARAIVSRVMESP